MCGRPDVVRSRRPPMRFHGSCAIAPSARAPWTPPTKALFPLLIACGVAAADIVHVPIDLGIVIDPTPGHVTIGPAFNDYTVNAMADLDGDHVFYALSA